MWNDGRVADRAKLGEHYDPFLSVQDAKHPMGGVDY
jgi:hypothetical protein